MHDKEFILKKNQYSILKNMNWIFRRNGPKILKWTPGVRHKFVSWVTCHSIPTFVLLTVRHRKYMCWGVLLYMQIFKCDLSFKKQSCKCNLFDMYKCYFYVENISNICILFKIIFRKFFEKYIWKINVYMHYQGISSTTINF